MAESTEKMAEPVLLGRISGVFGVAGWVKLFSYTEPREAILRYPKCLRMQQGEWVDANWVEGRRQGKTVVARLEGINDRDAAACLIGSDVGIWRQDLPEANDGNFYWTDLEGLTVVNKHGNELGVVAYMMATGANDVMVVQGDQEMLIPFITGHSIVQVDLAAGVIRVDWQWE